MRAAPFQVTKKVYVVGSSEITDPRDCTVYLVDFGELILVDAGAGPSAPQIVQNMEILGKNPATLSTVILTHSHIDHSGGARFFQKRFGAQIIMHEQDAGPVEQGDATRTAAKWYHLSLESTPVDMKLSADEQRLTFGSHTVVCLHTPGHTPGSISLYFDSDGQRVLFGQDIHGPFHRDFGSDLAAWRASMQSLLALGADILCEGHFGVYITKEKVSSYIRHYLETYDDESL